MTGDHEPLVDRMTIDRNAPVIVAADAFIAATPQVVWALLSDVPSWPMWHPGIRSATTDGPPAVGRRFVWRPGLLTKIVSVMQDVEPGSVIGWTGRTLGLTARHMWTVMAEGGGTRLHTEESMDGFLAKMVRRPLQNSVQRDLDSWLIHLSSAAEDRPPS